jgi:hypothetical protein
VVQADAVVGGLEWFRASSWDAEIVERFEAQLRRAQASNRAQYIRVQASHLLESSNASTRETGRALLRRVIDDHPDDDIQTNCAREQLGDSLAREGQLPEAESALRHLHGATRRVVATGADNGRA